MAELGAGKWCSECVLAPESALEFIYQNECMPRHNHHGWFGSVLLSPANIYNTGFVNQVLWTPFICCDFSSMHVSSFNTQISVRKRSFPSRDPLCIHCSTCYCPLSVCAALGHSLVCMCVSGRGWGEMSRLPLAQALTCLPVILWTRKETLSLSLCPSVSVSFSLSFVLSFFFFSQIYINLHKDFVQTSSFMHL